MKPLQTVLNAKKRIPRSGLPKDAVRSFDELKQHLISAPILAHPRDDIPYELHTDGSVEGLGVILVQKPDGVERVISYASRMTTKDERSYVPHT